MVIVNKPLVFYTGYTYRRVERGCRNILKIEKLKNIIPNLPNNGKKIKQNIIIWIIRE